MWQWLMIFMLGAVGQTARSAMIEYGQAKRGVFVWIGGHHLPTPLRFVGDPASGRVYAVDTKGQRYPLRVDRPEPAMTIDSALVERQAPGLLNPEARARRDALEDRLRQLSTDLVKQGFNPDTIASRLGDELRQHQDQVEDVRVNGSTVRYRWRGWSVVSAFSAGPNLPLLPVTEQMRLYVQSLTTTLNNGQMVILGWNEMYTVVPKGQIDSCQAEIDRLRTGQQLTGQLLQNPMILEPIRLRRSTQYWLKQANREE